MKKLKTCFIFTENEEQRLTVLEIISEEERKYSKDVAAELKTYVDSFEMDDLFTDILIGKQDS